MIRPQPYIVAIDFVDLVAADTDVEVVLLVLIDQ